MNFFPAALTTLTLLATVTACPPSGDDTSQTEATPSTGSTSTGPMSTSGSETTGEPSFDWLEGPFYTPYAFGGVDGQATLSQIWFHADGTAEGLLRMRCVEEPLLYDFLWVEVDSETVRVLPAIDSERWFFDSSGIRTVFVRRAKDGDQIVISSPDGAPPEQQPLGVYQPGEGCLVVIPEGSDCFMSTWAIGC